MKHLVIGVIVIGLILGGITYTKKDKIQYTKGDTQIVEKTVEVETLQKRIDDAIHASSTAIESEAQKAFETKKMQLQTEIELEVTRAYRAEIEERESKLEEQVSL
jgi:hypothetical protein